MEGFIDIDEIIGEIDEYLNKEKVSKNHSEWTEDLERKSEILQDKISDLRLCLRNPSLYSKEVIKSRLEKVEIFLMNLYLSL